MTSEGNMQNASLDRGREITEPRRLSSVSVAAVLHRAIEIRGAWQINDPSSPLDGAPIHPATGLPEAGAQVAATLAATSILLAREEGLEMEKKSQLRQSALRALEYLFCCRRSSGLFDLVACNPDSAPDRPFLQSHIRTTCQRFRRNEPNPQ